MRAVIDPWAAVVGQDHALAQLRAGLAQPVHAYLFVGPRGSGRRAAALVFAGELLGAGSDGEDLERHRRLAVAGAHPDLVLVEPEGRTVRREEADRLIREASRSPVEGHRKVLVATGFEAPEPVAMAQLLKILEEPPPGRVFILLAEDVPPETVTIASRCARVDFTPLTEAAIADQLTREGLDPERAGQVAAAAHGDLGRARLLEHDPRLALRLQAWRDVPTRLDGTGRRVAELVDELRAHIDDAEAPLREDQDRQVAELAAQVERYGQRGSGSRQVEERQRRERRRLRSDELRLGLAELARAARDGLATADDPAPALDALAAVRDAGEGLIRNPNEELMLQALLLRMSPPP